MTTEILRSMNATIKSQCDKKRSEQWGTVRKTHSAKEKESPNLTREKIGGNYSDAIVHAFAKLPCVCMEYEYMCNANCFISWRVTAYNIGSWIHFSDASFTICPSSFSRECTVRLRDNCLPYHYMQSDYLVHTDCCWLCACVHRFIFKIQHFKEYAVK